MHDESDFLSKLLENPADDTTRLVYADADSAAKSQFLRLTARMLDVKRPKGDDTRLQKLAAKLDTDWLAVVSRMKVEICARNPEKVSGRKGRSLPLAFDVICDKRWDEMMPTGDNAVRFCEGCKHNVYYCDTIMEARDHARKTHCVAIDLGIIRHEGDVSQLEMMILGRPSAASLERERKRTGVDQVSAERERRKREEK
jgi:uncharacterized protein (TIGR02996 family)